MSSSNNFIKLRGTTQDLFKIGDINLDSSLVGTPWSWIFPTGPGTAGQVLTSQAGGQMTWSAVGSAADQTTPYLIPVGETFTNNVNRQNLFTTPITVDGDLVVDGLLIQV